MLTGTLELSQNSSNSRTVHKSKPKRIEIVAQDNIYSVAFLVDGKHFVSGGQEGKIRRWRTEDGKEVGTPMDAGNAVYNLAVSRDGKWIVSGTGSGELAVWDVQSQKKVTEWKGHDQWVRGVDISPDGTRIATGSGSDFTVCVWSLSTGEQLLGPLEHDRMVVAVKFSPDGRLIAAATLQRSIRVYDSQNGCLLVDTPIKVFNFFNQSLVWVNSKNLLSADGNLNCLDVSTGTTRSSWPIHDGGGCIALASNGTFIAASSGSSGGSAVSFWDTTTHKQIGPIINHTYVVASMAISANYDLVISGGYVITLWNIRNVLPSSYYEDVSALA